MKLEIFGRYVFIKSRFKRGQKLVKVLNKNQLKKIYFDISGGLTEGAVIGKYKNVIGIWKIIIPSKNPLLN